MVWYCFTCQKIHKIDNESETERKLFPRYVDFIMCTLSGEPESLLKIVNNRGKNGSLAFLDINNNVNSSKKFKWYKKPTDRALSWISVALHQSNKKNYRRSNCSPYFWKH